MKAWKKSPPVTGRHHLGEFILDNTASIITHDISVWKLITYEENNQH